MIKLQIFLMLFALTLAGLNAVHAQKTETGDIVLKTYDNAKEFKLSDHRGQYVAFHFLLKTECPICLRFTRDYHNRSEQIAGVKHIFIKPDAPDDIQKWASKLGLDAGPPIYRDSNAQLAKQLNIPGGYQFHGESVHYPAMVLLNDEGEEVFRYVGKNNADRFDFKKFQQKIAELRGSGLRSEPGLGGNDPVLAKAGENIQGDNTITSQHGGVIYLFKTEENRKAFNEDPEKYL